MMEITLKAPRIELELVHMDKEGNIIETIKLDSEVKEDGNSSE